MSLRVTRTLLLYFSLQFFSEGKFIKSPSAFSSAYHTLVGTLLKQPHNDNYNYTAQIYSIKRFDVDLRSALTPITFWHSSDSLMFKVWQS